MGLQSDMNVQHSDYEYHFTLHAPIQVCANSCTHIIYKYGDNHSIHLSPEVTVNILHTNLPWNHLRP